MIEMELVAYHILLDSSDVKYILYVHVIKFDIIFYVIFQTCVKHDVDTGEGA